MLSAQNNCSCNPFRNKAGQAFSIESLAKVLSQQIGLAYYGKEQILFKLVKNMYVTFDL